MWTPPPPPRYINSATTKTSSHRLLIVTPCTQLPPSPSAWRWLHRCCATGDGDASSIRTNWQRYAPTRPSRHSLLTRSPRTRRQHCAPSRAERKHKHAKRNTQKRNKNGMLPCYTRIPHQRRRKTFKFSQTGGTILNRQKNKPTLCFTLWLN